MGNRYAIIPARGNSKGIVGKNLHPVGGKPLLTYTVEASLETGLFDEVIVSSEDATILSFASQLGAIATRRPDHLSRDDVHSVEVVLDVIRYRGLSADTVIVMLLPTSPLRRSRDIAAAVNAFEAADVDSLVSVYPDTKHLMNLRRIDPAGRLEALFPGDPNVQRQDLDELYVVNGSIYVSRVGTLLTKGSFHLGHVVPFIMERRVSVDINTLEDVEEVELKLAG